MATSLLAPLDDRLFATREPRARLLAVVAFALVTVSLSSPTAAICAFVLAALAATGSLPPRDLLRRLLALEGLMLVVLLTLPFSVPGTPLLGVGPLSASQEGLLAALLIVLKANAVVLAVWGLIGGLEPAVLGHALARLGAPAALVQLLLLTVRQIEVLQQEHLRLRQAMRARGFVARSNRHTWVSYGNLVGMLLVRSLERARRIQGAMRCRGFQGRFPLLDAGQWRAADTAFLGALLPLFGALLVLDALV